MFFLLNYETMSAHAYYYNRKANIDEIKFNTYKNDYGNILALSIFISWCS